MSLHKVTFYTDYTEAVNGTEIWVRLPGTNGMMWKLSDGAELEQIIPLEEPFIPDTPPAKPELQLGDVVRIKHAFEYNPHAGKLGIVIAYNADWIGGKYRVKLQDSGECDYFDADRLEFVSRPEPTEDAAPESCRSEEGVTTGLIDAMISILRVLSVRDMRAKAAQEALADLCEDPDLLTVLIARILRSMAEAERGETVDLGSFAQHLDEEGSPND